VLRFHVYPRVRGTFCPRRVSVQPSTRNPPPNDSLFSTLKRERSRGGIPFSFLTKPGKGESTLITDPEREARALAVKGERRAKTALATRPLRAKGLPPPSPPPSRLTLGWSRMRRMLAGGVDVTAEKGARALHAR